jgi:hypothetical protein
LQLIETARRVRVVSFSDVSRRLARVATAGLAFVDRRIRLARSPTGSGWVSRVLGFALLAASIAAVATLPIKRAHADKSDDDDDSADDDDDDDDDVTSTEGDDDDDDDDANQPPITAGGLFTLKTYPVGELQRPLTITEKILQAKIGLGIDVAAKTAFQGYGLNADVRYGFKDHVTGVAGFDNAYNFNALNIYGGVEAALAYDFIDIKTAFKVYRPAFATPDPANMDKFLYDHGDFKFSIDLGFPFRYKATKEIAIVALDTFMTFDLNEANGNKVTPDLNPSLGIATNPIPPVSIVLFATLQVVDFDTKADNFVIPATARVQFSPNRKLDLGLEFSFLNVKPPDPQKFYDNRFVLLYGQFRVGR